MLRPLKNYLFCILSAVLLALPFTNFNLWIFAWFGFIPFLFVLQNKTPLKAFLLAYFTGVIFWSVVIYWLIHVTVLGTIILILYLSLYFGLFGFIIAPRITGAGKRVLVFIPVVWVLLEFLRSYLLTGFPWAVLGYSQTSNLAVIQIADITGTWGISFLVVLVNMALYMVCFAHPAKNIRKQIALITLTSAAIVLGYGFLKLLHTDKGPSVVQERVAVVQGNIPQELKWDRHAQEYIINKYTGLTHKALNDSPDLIIWPEASWPFLLTGEDILDKKGVEFLDKLNSPLIFGAVTVREGLYYNSAIFSRRNSKSLGIYDKLHLVPFGEYIPLKRAFPFLETIAPIGDITRGNRYAIFSAKNDFSVLICFEDLFPELSRRFVSRGATFLVNITNDAWYKETTAAYQHLQASIMRAVENRVPVIRSANTGISAFIDNKGRVVSLVQDNSGRKIFIEGIASSSMNIVKGNHRTVYNYIGDLFIVFCLFYFIYFLAAPYALPHR
ncbi:apolipoprotein N-acyltransferase [bacterium]|nr:MAG: apolipoprotein N-acyltransferase [bacterium]